VSDPLVFGDPGFGVEPATQSLLMPDGTLIEPAPGGDPIVTPDYAPPYDPPNGWQPEIGEEP
jgi:hypothetical protein